jgi:large exoprotein involved in heme utilization and adhesion
MNPIYQTLWNETLKSGIAISKSGNRIECQKLLIVSLSLYGGSAWALPTGHDLLAGQATVATPTANHMQINQASQRAAFNWQGFSIGQQESVNIRQPNAMPHYSIV